MQIIIIGAGAAGLMAAQLLAKKGHTITVLEAADRIGGRIHTIQPTGFTNLIDAGAEFVHGKLPITLGLLKEAKIDYVPLEGEMYRVQQGSWSTQEEFAIGWDEIIEQMNALQEDITLHDFLQRYYSGEQYVALRESVQRFAEGFDLADPAKVSTFSIREEWAHEQDEQFRIPGGYHQLINYLQQQCIDSGGKVIINSEVKHIEWSANHVRVTDTNNNSYTANKVIIAVPIGVLQANTISFQPAIDNYMEAVRNIGFGSVIKIQLEFKEAFWRSYKDDIGFILSSERVPTWWTMLPDERPLLAGWLGGPQAAHLYNETDDTILQYALQSLAKIFNEKVEALSSLLTASHIANWHNNPLVRGAYSYSTLQTAAALQVLHEPVEQTIFFAGEAYYNGADSATVEAALASAQAVVDKL